MCDEMSNGTNILEAKETVLSMQGDALVSIDMFQLRTTMKRSTACEDMG